jgi:hypothetical protein
MSALTQLAEMIRDTQAELARAEQAIAQRGELSFGLELAVESLEHRLEDLQGQFQDATAAEEIDVCSYRLVSAPGRYPVASVGRTFVAFQSLFSVLYDSIKRGQPRRRAKIAPESEQESTFDFGYAYAGSLGFVFTLPNERLLLGESLLDTAMSKLMEFPRANSTEEVSALAKMYGAAPVRLAYQWALAHVDAGLSIDLEWRRQNEVRLHMLAQVPELKRLTDLIASASDFDRETVKVYGQLVGMDIVGRTFRLVVGPREEIRGSLHESFKTPEPCIIGQYYTAAIDVQTRVRYATEAEEKDHYLLSLTPGLAIENQVPAIDKE